MKIFDSIGIVVVAVWLGLAGVYVYNAQTATSGDEAQRSEQFVMREGSTWLVLRRGDQDAGFVHQARTALADGWLIEHDTYMIVELQETPQLIDASVKSRLDVDGYLRQFTTEIITSAGVFRAAGKVDGNTLELSTTIDQEVEREQIALDKPLRMSPNALNALLATETFVPDERYGGRFVDPYRVEVVDVEMRFIENRPLKVYDETFQADHFRKRAGTRELDFYVDKDADLLIRAFPLRTTSARIPVALGKTRSASIRRQLEEQSAETSQDDSQANAPTLSLAVARQILAGVYQPETPTAD